MDTVSQVHMDTVSDTHKYGEQYIDTLSVAWPLYSVSLAYSAWRPCRANAQTLHPQAYTRNPKRDKRHMEA